MLEARSDGDGEPSSSGSSQQAAAEAKQGQLAGGGDGAAEPHQRPGSGDTSALDP